MILVAKTSNQAQQRGLSLSLSLSLCVFIKLHVTAQSGPVILVILWHSHRSSLTMLLVTKTSDQARVCVCCHPIYSVRQTCGRTSRVHTRGRSHRISPPSFCGACLNFVARRIQPSLSLVDREVEFCLFVGLVPRFELMSQRQKVPRLPTKPPVRHSFPTSTTDTDVMDICDVKYLSLCRLCFSFALIGAW